MKRTPLTVIPALHFICPLAVMFKTPSTSTTIGLVIVDNVDDNEPSKFQFTVAPLLTVKPSANSYTPHDCPLISSPTTSTRHMRSVRVFGINEKNLNLSYCYKAVQRSARKLFLGGVQKAQSPAYTPPTFHATLPWSLTPAKESPWNANHCQSA